MQLFKKIEFVYISWKVLNVQGFRTTSTNCKFYNIFKGRSYDAFLKKYLV